jgi:hypothetical protein
MAMFSTLRMIGTGSGFSMIFKPAVPLAAHFVFFLAAEFGWQAMTCAIFGLQLTTWQLDKAVPELGLCNPKELAGRLQKSVTPPQTSEVYRYRSSIILRQKFQNQLTFCTKLYTGTFSSIRYLDANPFLRVPFVV